MLIPRFRANTTPTSRGGSHLCQNTDPQPAGFDFDLNMAYNQVKLEVSMKLKKAIKPISYLKAHASELISDVAENHKTLVITQNGEAKVVLQDIETYEHTQESLSLLKILAVSTAHQKAGKTKPLSKAFKDVRARIEKAK